MSNDNRCDIMDWKKILNKALSIIMWASTALFVIYSVALFIDYNIHPQAYAIMSAPWYLSICLYAIGLIIVLVICLLIKIIIGNKK